MYGTDLAETLRRLNYAGLIFICSANSTDSDMALYLESGAVDACVGKGGSSKDLALRIQEKYAKRRNRKPKHEAATGVSLDLEPP